MKGKSLLERLSPFLMFLAGGIYLVFAAYLLIMAIDAYQGGLSDIINALEPYMAYLVYLIPVALALGFLGWYFGAGRSPTATIVMTIGSATLLSSFLIYWGITGALFDTLVAYWIYWVPPAINLLLGAYAIIGAPGVTAPPPSALEALLPPKRRRTLRSAYPRGYSAHYRAIRFSEPEEITRRRALRRI
ncbi:MAG: hypothetical protein DRJ38_01935 [Thermoprotei archaeon]|nr:MAG: hypothetical protein DRJ38_01935 [Thermoprotei archaeon]